MFIGQIGKKSEYKLKVKFFLTVSVIFVNGPLIIKSLINFSQHVNSALRITGEKSQPLPHIFSNMGKAYDLQAIPKECPEGKI